MLFALDVRFAFTVPKSRLAGGRFRACTLAGSDQRRLRDEALKRVVETRIRSTGSLMAKVVDCAQIVSHTCI